MRVRKQDANGDMTFGNGELDFFIDVPQGVAQVINTRLRLWQGEYFLDNQEGTPLAASVLGKNKLLTAQPALVARILGSPGVTNVINFNLGHDPINRRLNMTATAVTNVGAITINEIF